MNRVFIVSIFYFLFVGFLTYIIYQIFKKNKPCPLTPPLKNDI